MLDPDPFSRSVLRLMSRFLSELEAKEPEERTLRSLLEVGCVVHLIDAFELTPGGVVLIQHGARCVLTRRQAVRFIAGALNYTMWSYMSAYPLQREGHLSLNTRDARRLMQRDFRVRHRREA